MNKIPKQRTPSEVKAIQKKAFESSLERARRTLGLASLRTMSISPSKLSKLETIIKNLEDLQNEK